MFNYKYSFVAEKGQTRKKTNLFREGGYSKPVLI
jgi:hypothetical protein